MKLFIRDQFLFVSLFFMQLGALLLIFQLDGYSSGTIVLYAIFLSLFFSGVYLIIRYWANRKVYHYLGHSIQSLDELTQSLGETPLAEAMAEVFQQHYRLYMEQLHLHENKQREYNTFIQQWVHQMKTPISVIHLLLQNEDSPATESIREEVDRLKRGLETVLYTARLERFEQDFLIEPVHLHSLVQGVLLENKRLFIRNQVYPEVRVDEQWRVESDDKWLSFVLTQLLTNAVRYSAGISRKVLIQAYARGSMAVLEVKDQGIGIPKEDMERVFQPFFTGENGRKYPESTGMGLYLVKEVCRRLDHSLELESRAGKGTTVRIIFPAVANPLQ
ncbi:MAG TPA: sensor histidine kinase [Candidatus Bathyarchaeia archaeon]|nr:sensor histidine kinase [Candidatus Bathyarchaeia archaeon]